jgi:hypothetical protein
LPRIHHDHPLADLGHHAEVVGDQDHRGPRPLLQLQHQVEDLRLDGDVERGRRLVGDQELGVAGQGHGDHHPLAHAARELVRVVAEPALGIGDAHELEHLDRALLGLGPAGALVDAHGLGDLVPMVRTGFKDVIGSWKIIAIRLPRISRIRSSGASGGPCCP